MQKYIKCSNVKWTQEALLRLIHIKKRNVAQQKSAKRNNDRWHFIPLRNLIGDAKVVTLKKGSAISGRPDLTINDQKRRSPKKDAAGKKYINTNNSICANYKCKISLQYYRHNFPILAKKWFSLYNFGHLFRNKFVKKI